MANYDTFKPNQGSTDYLTKIPAHIDATEAIATEIENARQGQTTLLANMQTVVRTTGLTVDLNAGNYKITDLADAVNSSDAVTLQQAQAILSGGGSPADIAVTGLNVGSMLDGEILGRAGNALVGISQYRPNAARNYYLRRR